MPCFSSLQRLYREKGENMKHNYTLSGELPEMVQAKLNAMNLSEVKDTWHACTSGSQSVRSISCFSAWGFFPYWNEIIHLLCAFSERLQGILDEDTWRRLQAAPGCHSFPVRQNICRDPQQCELPTYTSCCHVMSCQTPLQVKLLHFGTRLSKSAKESSAKCT